jgi:hypothetical protein
MKPGWKTTEFWLSLIATVCGILMASGAIVPGSQIAQIIGGVMSVLAVLGYQAGRTSAKNVWTATPDTLPAPPSEPAAPLKPPELL